MVATDERTYRRHTVHRATAGSVSLDSLGVAAAEDDHGRGDGRDNPQGNRKRTVELAGSNPCEFELPSGKGAPGESYEKQQAERKRQLKDPFDADLGTLVTDSEDSLESIWLEQR